MSSQPVVRLLDAVGFVLQPLPLSIYNYIKFPWENSIDLVCLSVCTVLRIVEMFVEYGGR